MRPETENIELNIKKSSFSLQEIHIKLSDHRLKVNENSIELSDVTAIKFGISPIQVDMFYIGRKYQIHILTNESKNPVSIVFKSYFSLSNKEFYTFYTQLVNILWAKIVFRLFEERIEILLAGGSFEINHCTISVAGIKFKQHDFLNKTTSFIPWNDCQIHKGYDKLTINSKQNSKCFTYLPYLQGWNVDVLYAVLEWVLEEGGREQLSAIKE